MKTQVENVSEVKKVIQFEIPWEDVDKHIKEAVRQISRTARIPGFRKGKAPDNLIRTRYAQQIKEDVMNHVIPEAYKNALKENQFEVVSEPALQDVVYAEGSPFSFKVTVEIKPKIELKDYKGLEVKVVKVEVTDEEVEAVLKSYQERAAELIPQPDISAQKGHFINAHLKATIEEKGKQRTLFDRQTQIELGAEGNHPAFNENLMGKKVNDALEFDADYPEDYPEKSIAGKRIHYEAKIESINEKRIAPLDDEFAKDLGDFSSLVEVREKIRMDIQKMKNTEQRNQCKDQLLKQIIEKHLFEVPEVLVRKETESLMRDYAVTLRQKGVDLQDSRIDWKEVQERFSKQAEQNIRGSMIMAAIADVEKIEVANEDLERAIGQMADQQRRAQEAVKAELVKGEKMDILKDRIRLAKTLDFVLDHAKTQM